MEPLPFHYTCRPKPDDIVSTIDPNIQIMLDELQKMEIRLSDRIEGRCSNLERRVEEVEQKAEARFISLEMAQLEYEHWSPEVEKKVNDVKLEVHHLNKFLERESLERSGTKPSIFSGSASAHPPAGFSADGPQGHRVDKYHRDHEFGSVYTQTLVAVTGMNNDSHPRHYNSSQEHSYHRTTSFDRAGHGKLPKMHFPQFDSDNPKLWKTRSENYF